MIAAVTRALRTLGILGALALVLVGCNDGGPIDPNNVAGTYRLHSIDGRRPPVRLGDWEVMSGTMQLLPDGRYLDETVVRPLGPGGSGPTIETETGTYVVYGETVELRPDLGPRTHAAISGRELIFRGEVVAIYRR